MLDRIHFDIYMNSVVTDLWMGMAESIAMLRQFFNILKIFYSMFQKLFVRHKTQKTEITYLRILIYLRKYLDIFS